MDFLSRFLKEIGAASAVMSYHNGGEEYGLKVADRHIERFFKALHASNKCPDAYEREAALKKFFALAASGNEDAVKNCFLILKRCLQYVEGDMG